MGAVPKWFFITVLLPARAADEKTVESVFSSVHRACTETGISVCGGHTEVTHGIDRPLVCGHMIGEADKEKLVLPSNAKEGDTVILAGGAAVEATSIIAREKEQTLRNRGYGESVISECADYIYNPGISVVREAAIALKTAQVHAMHDPTEGGIRTGLWELAEACGMGIEVYPERIFCSENTRRLCAEFDIDPLGAISSGALLIALHPSDAEALRERFEEEGIASATVASFKPLQFGRKTDTGAEVEYSVKDEITKLFG
jgi:hydrogenase maturation factor